MFGYILANVEKRDILCANCYGHFLCNCDKLGYFLLKHLVTLLTNDSGLGPMAAKIIFEDSAKR